MSSKPVIVWFTHDLRLSDHAALTRAAGTGQPIIPVYILDDETPDDFAMGGAARWWLQQSLKSLAASISKRYGTLVLRRGNALKVLENLLDETGAGALYFSRNYAPWSADLEKQVSELCSSKSIECKRFAGYLLHNPEDIRTGSDGPYKVYTPFSRKCFEAGVHRDAHPVPDGISFVAGGIATDSLDDWSLYDGKPDWASRFQERWTPGEAGAQEKLDRFLKDAVGDYDEARNLPRQFSTSRLSPHLHFGEISPLQCWHACRHAMDDDRRNVDGGGHTFLKELLWREFSYHLLHYWPNLPTEPFKPEFGNFPWADDSTALKNWQRGQTGIPVVDAGMRELWATGWMHNRVRMIVASFLVKNLRVPWQQGERWFWDTLVDADIGSNSAGWQWVAGCGADAAPFFRIFNPVLQGEKFDKAGEYVRTWVPELKDMPSKYIHKPWDAPADVLSNAGVKLGTDYPRPIADLGETRQAALDAYKTIRKSDEAA